MGFFSLSEYFELEEYSMYLQYYVYNKLFQSHNPCALQLTVKFHKRTFEYYRFLK